MSMRKAMNYKNVVDTQQKFIQLLRKFNLLKLPESGWNGKDVIEIRLSQKERYLTELLIHRSLLLVFVCENGM